MGRFPYCSYVELLECGIFWVMGEDFERIDGFFSAILDG